VVRPPRVGPDARPASQAARVERRRDAYSRVVPWITIDPVRPVVVFCGHYSRRADTRVRLYSGRRAVIGAMRSERSAGAQHDPMPTVISTAATPAKTTGSCGDA